MVPNRITEGVGKRIVDALKQQPDVEVKSAVQVSEVTEQPENLDFSDSFDDGFQEDIEFEEVPQATFINTQARTFERPQRDSFAADLEDFEMPANVAVLKQLISQLPAGVSKQTGAHIIKQTMEALGISMKNVLQEAQQVQESLNNSSRECQASAAEYKKQISMLEKQSQKYQRQYAALNDIISLFIQTNI